jgi:hypothetical protein
MKIAMHSDLIHLYERMLNPNDRQKETRPGLRYSEIDQEAFKIIDALDKIYKSGARFCKLPSNEIALKKFPKADKSLPECCVRGLDLQKINKRIDELRDHDEDLEEECKLLAEAEECGVNILLTRNGKFIRELGKKSKNVMILKPPDYLKEVRS